MSDAARTERAGPAWEVARLFPDQGHWGEADYLELTEHTRRIVDPRHERVHLLVSKDGVYESTEHHRGDRVASRLLTGLVVEVAATLDSARI